MKILNNQACLVETGPRLETPSLHCCGSVCNPALGHGSGVVIIWFPRVSAFNEQPSEIQTLIRD